MIRKIKQYFKGLWLALKGKNYHNYYDNDYHFPVCWDLDYFIVNAVKYYLPKYNSGHPSKMSEEEWNNIKNELITLAEKITDIENPDYDFPSLKQKALENEINDQKRFAELLGKYLFNLWD